MNELETLKEELKKLEEKIEKLEKEKESKVWKPKDGNIYFYNDNDGDVFWENWADRELDKLRYTIGNVFKEKEQAEAVLEKLKIYTKLKRLAEEINTEPVDWENSIQRKYVIFYRTTEGLKQEYCTIYKDIGQIYCTNEKFLEIALEQIGEENLLKLFKE